LLQRVHEFYVERHMTSNGVLACHYHGSSSTNCQAPSLVKADF
jgi:hypothetical protein